MIKSDRLFKKTKRFLFNKEKKYSKKEICINWLIWFSFFGLIFFGILFEIYSQDITIESLTTLNSQFSLEANIFSTISFLSFISLISSLIIKIIMIRKRKKKIKNNEINKK